MPSPTPHQSNVLPEGDDVVQQSFPTPLPMVVCLVRHLNRSMAQVATPPSVEHCIVELQSYFQPFIEARQVNERCLPGSRLRMQFGKAIDIDACASSSLLNLYIFAVDQDYSRPRVFAHVAKEWRARLEKEGREGSCFVMLYHKDLVDAASVSVRRVTGEPSAETHNQKKTNAAAAILEAYFDELRSLKFDPHQMCKYLPNEAQTRVVERLRAAYEDRTAQLSNLFDSYRQQRQQQWNIRECWRRGYDLVKHFLQFSAIADAAAVFARMFDQYYYNSEDYSFVKSRAVLEQLGRLSDLFCSGSTGAVLQGGHSGFPDVLRDDSEYANELLFFAACEIRCLLLLGRRDAAFARFRTFMQVAREKLSEPDTAALVGDACRLLFLLRCYLSAMRLQWGLDKNDSSSNNNNNNNNSLGTCSGQGSGATTTPLVSFSSVMDRQVDLASSHINGYNAFGGHAKDRDDAIEDEKDSQRVVAAWERWEVLCASLGVDSFDDGEKEREWRIRLFAHLTSNALEILTEMGELLGYYSERDISARSCPTPDTMVTGSSCADSSNAFSSSSSSAAEAAAAREAVQRFGMTELMSAEAFVTFYRALTELAALSFRLAGRRHMEHGLYYRLALSHLPDSPTVTANICRQRLIPFVLRHGWSQLQSVVHRLYVDTMDIVVAQRKAAGRAAFQEGEEALMLREALLRMIHALSIESGTPHLSDLTNRVDQPTQVELVDDLWRRFCHIDTMHVWSSAPASIRSDDAPRPEGPFSLLSLLSNARVMCVTLPERGIETASSISSLSPSGANPARAQIGDAVELRFTSDCLVSAIGAVDSAATLTATLVSKKDWADPEEQTHVLPVTRVACAARDAETGRVSWTWVFCPCHAGAYRLRSVTLSIAGATLIYVPNDGGNNNNNNEGNGADGNVQKGAIDVLLIVPEPDIGIQVCVTPPAEPHCFGDAINHITVHVEIEKPLYLPPTGPRTAMDCSLEAPCASVASRRASRRSLQSGMPFARASVSMPETAVLPRAHPHALAVICVSRARHTTQSRAFFPNNPVTSCGGGSGNGDGVELFAVHDERSGTTTTVPINEVEVMSRMPAPVLSRGGSGADPVDLRMDGYILVQRQQCCYNIHVQDESTTAGGTGELLDANSLRCELPLLPPVMDSKEGAPAIVSMRCQRNMESCTTDVTVPLRFVQAFAVRHVFNCTQSRVYCTVRVENVLPSVSLWVRGALLDLCDAKPYYTLARVSSTYERLTTREWRPGEAAQLLFELAPTANQPHAHAEEIQHRVRLQLFYSPWSSTEGLESLASHTLRPHNAHVESSFRMSVSTGTCKTFISVEEHANNYSVMERNEREDSPALYNDEDGFDAGVMEFTQQPHVCYDPAHIEELRYKCNTFHGPLVTFTSRYSCLFNAVIFVDPNDAANQNAFATDAAGRDAAPHSPLAPDVSVVDLPGGVVFPAGEPVRFSVLLEPLAHNWPEESTSEEDFLVAFVADPAAWLVTGRQKVRAVLSMMDEVTFWFTAVPVPPEGGGGRESIAVVPTPSVEVRWAARPDEAPVAVEVVQFRSSMRIRL